MQLYAHQSAFLQATTSIRTYALLWEMGLGKTLAALMTAKALWSSREITGVLVVTANGVRHSWKQEVEKFLPDIGHHLRWRSLTWEKDMKETDSAAKLVVFVMNAEAFATARGVAAATAFLKRRKALLVIDESHMFKNPSAQRTKTMWKLAPLATYRRIMTGTPIANGPLDLYAQFRILHPDILGFSSYYAFRARYAVMKPLPGRIVNGRQIEIVVGFKNVDELTEKVKVRASILRKEDCLDLPPKVYRQPRMFDLSKQQRSWYDELKKSVMMEIGGGRMTAPMVMTKLMRLHQISCGFLQLDDGAIVQAEENPRIEALMELLEECHGKAIIWASYRESIRAICAAIDKKYGPGVGVHFYGDTSEEDRRYAVEGFQDLEPSCPIRFFVGHPAAGGVGITLTAARDVIYFSSGYSYVQRVQSEDRAHRIGQTKSVSYTDILGVNTVDHQILAALVDKQELSSQLTGERLRAWLTEERS